MGLHRPSHKLRRHSLLFVGLTLVAVVGLGACESPCVNEVVRRIPSPDNRLEAVIFERGCGATTAGSTQVSLLPKGAELPDEPANVFVINHPSTAAAEWTGPDRLLITYPAGARVVKSETAHEGVTITYRER